MNTNGGFTFGGGDDEFDLAAVNIGDPGVAVFWGDMNAGAHGADIRSNQMVYEQLSDRFVITYTEFQDNDDASWNNTATVTLFSNGTFVVDYGIILSEYILVGVFDGTHIDDRFSEVQSIYPNYQTIGTGIILFDDFGSGPTIDGDLNNKTIIFEVIPEPSTYALLTMLVLGGATLRLRDRKKAESRTRSCSWM